MAVRNPLARILARPGETLPEHTLRVLARVDQLAALRPLPDFPHLYPRLRWAALLHDSGKLARGFQRGLRSRKARWGLRHEALSLAFLGWIDVPEEDYVWVVAAIATHHRDASFILDRYRRDSTLEALIAELEPDSVQAWYHWLRDHAPDPSLIRPFSAPTVSPIRQALTALDGWFTPLQAQGPAHPDFAQAVLLRGTIIQADHAASAGARDFSPQRWMNPPQPAGSPYPHQQACAQSGGAEVLLIAPTGSGKTEAALLWAGEGSSRLFYTLPYRASMNAMAHRLSAFAPSDQVGLQHGRALQSLYRDLLAEGQSARNATQEANARLNLARLHAYPIRVFSPYHLLQAAYQLKGFEAGLTDCAGSRLIVDEIHAYQPERLALILPTLAFLRRHFQTRLLIMTATLPRLVREVITESLPGLTLIQADRATYARFRRHQIKVCEGTPEDSLETLLKDAQAGKKVLVTVNTVRRARLLTRLLKAQGCEVLTLHGRFNHEDRWRLERAILARFAPDAPPLPQPLIVVATQVIEVSLNLSFDTLYTDPAPLDALIQRFGRVNRRPDPGTLAPVQVFSQPTGAEMKISVYDPALVEASVDLLRAHAGEGLDEANITEWLDQVYSGERAARWQKLYQERRAFFERFVLGELHPFESADEGLFQQFLELFDGLEVLPLELEEEYRARLEADPIGASLLLVPAAFWQYKMLERARRAWQEGELYLTDATYSSEDGLALETDEES